MPHRFTKEFVRQINNIMEKQIDDCRQLYTVFEKCSCKELENILLEATTREEKAFFRALLNLKLQIEQEKIIGEHLV